MTTSVFSFRFRRSMVAMAVCATGVAAQAQSDSVETVLSFGAALVSGTSADRAQFGQYNDLRSDRNLAGTLGIDYSLRKESTSTWVQLQGSNLLGNTRELHLVWKNPGDWKVSADYGELVRYNPDSVNTGVLGVGSSTPQVVNMTGGAGSGSDLDLRTKRTALGLGFGKWLTPALEFQLDLKNEKKEGARLSGTGMNCPSVIAPTCGSSIGWALLMLPEPISANHSQIEARLNYAMDHLRISLGYYGSYYRNDNSTMNPLIPGALNTTSNASLIGILGLPLALAPDNQAHQFDLSGSFDLGSTTRGNFKFGRAVATQNRDFAAAGLGFAPTGVSSMGGQFNTSSAKLSLSSRPLPQLSLLADLRYQNRDDQTPIWYYNTEGTSTYTNHAQPNLKANGKLQASWAFSSDYRGTLGADRETIDRGAFTTSAAVSGISALRQKTEENTVRAELRRRMSDDFSGSISLSSSRRSGSNWLKDNSGLGLTEVTNVADPGSGFLPTAIFMPTVADRKRDKIKLFSDWQPIEGMTLQFSAESGKDRFDTPGTYGLRDSRMSQLSVDGSYALSDNWALNGYLSQSMQSIDLAHPAGYLLAFDNRNVGANLGVSGKLSATLEIGGGLTYTSDRSVYDQGLDAFAGPYNVALLAATGGLPDIVYSQTALKLFGKYTLNKTSSLRVDFIHQRNNVNDWTWSLNGVPFLFSDGSTVIQKPYQSVSVIGVTYSYQLP